MNEVNNFKIEFFIWQIIILLVVFGIPMLGRNRRIGYGWSLFFTIFFTPLGGLIVIMLSPKEFDFDMEESKTKVNASYYLKAISSILIAGSILQLTNRNSYDNSPTTGILGWMIYIGLFGLGVYLKKLGKNEL